MGERERSQRIVYLRLVYFGVFFKVGAKKERERIGERLVTLLLCTGSGNVVNRVYFFGGNSVSRAHFSNAEWLIG